MRKLLVFGVLALTVMMLAIFSPTSVLASPIMDFHVFGTDVVPAGTIDWDGAGGIIGADIFVDAVSLGGNTLYLGDAILEFGTTGVTPFLNGSGDPILYQFGAGGYIRIKKNVDAGVRVYSDIDRTNQIGTISAAPLLEGTWNDGGFNAIIDQTDPTGAIFGDFDDEKNQMLFNLFGQDIDPVDELIGLYHGSIALSMQFLTQNLDSPYDFTAVSLSGDVNNVVPIPSAVLLLGSGLMGLVGLRRKFQS